MRYSAIVMAIGALALNGCATTGGGGISVAMVQQDAVAVCSFLPTASTVANIIAAGNPLLITAEAIAQAICAAVTAAPAVTTRRGAAQPMVNGVPVRGKFLR